MEELLSRAVIGSLTQVYYSIVGPPSQKERFYEEGEPAFDSYGNQGSYRNAYTRLAHPCSNSGMWTEGPVLWDWLLAYALGQGINEFDSSSNLQTRPDFRCIVYCTSEQKSINECENQQSARYIFLFEGRIGDYGLC